MNKDNIKENGTERQRPAIVTLFKPLDAAIPEAEVLQEPFSFVSQYISFYV